MKKILIIGYPFDQSRQFAVEFDSLEQEDLIKGFQRVIDENPGSLLAYGTMYDAIDKEDDDCEEEESNEKSNIIVNVILPIHDDGGPAYLDIEFKDGRSYSFHSSVVIAIMNLL